MAAGALESELAMKRSELQALFMEIKDMEERVGAAGGDTLGAGGMSGESPEIQLVRVNQQLMQAFEVNDRCASACRVCACFVLIDAVVSQQQRKPGLV